MSKEEWRAVVGWEGLYEVSSLGRVRSLNRYTPNALTGGESLVTGRILTGRINRNGYVQFLLCSGPRRETRVVHRLVAIAFIPNPDARPMVLHGPGGKLVNRVENLRWGTQSDNMLDRRRDGTDPMLNKTHCPQGHPYEGENLVLERDGSRKCRKCQSFYRKERIRRLQEIGLRDGDHRHGTRNGYAIYACRCEPCRDANRSYIPPGVVSGRLLENLEEDSDGNA